MSQMSPPYNYGVSYNYSATRRTRTLIEAPSRKEINLLGACHPVASIPGRSSFVQASQQREAVDLFGYPVASTVPGLLVLISSHLFVSLARSIARC